VREIHPEFSKCPSDIRVAFKKRVKAWLKQELHEQWTACIIICMKSNNDSHQTYGIPPELREAFKSWAANEIIVLKKS
jgi:hypothetical protein